MFRIAQGTVMLISLVADVRKIKFLLFLSKSLNYSGPKLICIFVKMSPVNAVLCHRFRLLNELLRAYLCCM